MTESAKTLTEVDVEGTLNKLRAAETDRKVDIVQLFGLQLEDVAELPESTIDPILLLLPPLVRSSHTLLLTSTLTSLLPFFIPLIPTTPQTHARLAVMQLLPSLIERVNDPKDRIHGAAALAIYLLGRRVHEAEHAGPAGPAGTGGAASTSTNTSSAASLGQSTSKGKEKETLVQSFERQLRDALAGKAWRAKVEIMKVLVKLRADLGAKMGLKAWLSILVDLLEDGDGNVRDQARETVVALLSPASTPPAARSELKKLLLARGVRKTIADNIIARVLGGPAATAGEGEIGRMSGASTPVNGAERPLPASRNSLNGETNDGLTVFGAGSGRNATGAAAGRSGANTPLSTTGSDDVEVVYVASPRDLEHEFAAMLPFFEGKETEQNWAPREKSVVRIRGMLRGQVANKYHEAFVAGLKSGIVDGVSKTIVSLRTTVAQQSCFLVRELVETLESSFDPFVEHLLPILGKMAGFTKKIIAERSQACVTAIIVHTNLHPRVFITHIAAGVGEKNIQTRHFCTGHLKTFLDIHGSKSKSTTESTAGLLDLLEGAIKKALSDVNPAVRELARAAFWSYHSVWTQKAVAIMNGLDGQARKQLEKANPHENDGANLVSSASAAAAATTTTTAPTAKAAPNRRATSTMGALLAERRRAKAAELAAGRVAQESPRTVSNPVPSSPSIQQGGLTRSNSTVALSSRNTRSGHSSRAATSPEAPSEMPESHEDTVATSPTPAQRTAPRPAPDANHSSPSNRDSPLRQSQTAPQHAGSPLRSTQSPGSSSTASSAHPLRTPTLSRRALPSFSGEGGAQVGLGLRTPAGKEEQEWDGHQGSATPSRLSSTAGSTAGMVDDARKAQVAQAESAARQLVEYAEDESVQQHTSTTASSARAQDPITPARPGTNGNALHTPLAGNGIGNAGTSSTTPSTATPATNGHLFKTPQPLGRRAWEDSPRPEAVTPLMVEKLKERRHERSWWVRRQELLDKASPLRPSASGSSLDSAQAIAPDLEALESGQAANGDDEEDDERVVWRENRTFERVLAGLFKYLSSDSTESDKVAKALVVLWEMVQHQWALFDGHEQDLCHTLFSLRAHHSATILESTNALISLLTEVSDPIYFLSTLRTSLAAFLASPPPASSWSSAGNDGVDTAARISGYSFGLMGMGMCVLRLPKAVIEAEGERLGELVMQGMQESTIVRQAAQSLLLAIQCVLADSAKTLALVPGLNKGQKDLAVYYMARNGILEDQSQSDGIPMEGKEEKVLAEMVGLMARSIK